MRARSLVVVLLLATGLVAPVARADGYQVKKENPIYIPMKDGTLLHASVQRPDAPGRFPVILLYGPYGGGQGAAASNDLINWPEMVPRGYAILHVSIRGTGCSGGVFDVFSEQEALDGAEIVEWAARQPWSDGNVGMSGNSYLATTQFFVAAKRPRGLRAIAPFHIHGDIYRDVAYPGGILNDAFVGLWTLALQPGLATAGGTAPRLSEGDLQCAQNLQHQAGNPERNGFRWAATLPTDGPEYWLRSPVRVADGIEVPVLLGQAWQDDQIGSRGLVTFEALRSPKRLLVTNGVHPTPKAVFWREVIRFFDYWLKGVDNHVMDEPVVTAYFETDASTTPNFVRTYDAWPPREAQYTPFYLRGDGILRPTSPAGVDPERSYIYPAGAQSTQAYGAPPAGALTYSTEPFVTDTVLVGPAALSLYAATTATDTDFYVSLSEVDARGNVTYVQKGMLRASHRAVVEGRSTPQRPYHPHTNPEPVEPDAVVRYDIEFLPAGQAFRAGSRLRLDIIAPPVVPELWGFVPTLLPAVNTIYSAPGRESALWLPLAPAGDPLPPARACQSLTGQPCRLAVA